MANYNLSSYSTPAESTYQSMKPSLFWSQVYYGIPLIFTSFWIEFDTASIPKQLTYVGGGASIPTTGQVFPLGYQ